MVIDMFADMRAHKWPLWDKQQHRVRRMTVATQIRIKQTWWEYLIFEEIIPLWGVRRIKWHQIKLL